LQNQLIISTGNSDDGSQTFLLKYLKELNKTKNDFLATVMKQPPILDE